MRGNAARQATELTAVTPDALIPQCHPIRRIKPMVDKPWPNFLPPLTGCTRPTASIHVAGAPAERVPADSVVLGAQRGVKGGVRRPLSSPKAEIPLRTR